MNRVYPLRFAIYYTRQGWPLLFKSCLLPLIQQLETAAVCNTYALYFSEEQGEHIRLELHLHPTASHKIPIYQSIIETFLAAHPTQRADKPLPLIDSFFLDLPNNSVYISSFKPHLSHTAQLPPQQGVLIRKEISALMLNTFAETTVNQNSLFNFYLCLEIIALSVFNDLQEAVNLLQTDCKKLAGHLPPTEVNRLKDEASKLIKNNHDDLDQMVILMQYDSSSADTQWLDGWRKTCREVAKTLEPLSLFREISMLICQQINFHHTKWSLLSLMTINNLLTNQNRSIHCTT